MSCAFMLLYCYSCIIPFQQRLTMLQPRLFKKVMQSRDDGRMTYDVVLQTYRAA